MKHPAWRFVLVALLLGGAVGCGQLAGATAPETAQLAGGLKIDPKAEIHPTAILMGNITVGAYTKIGPKVVIQGDVAIGHHVNILGNAVISAERLTVGNYVRIDYGAKIVNGRPAVAGITANKVRDQLYIRDNCWIGINATVRGARLEEGSVAGNDAVADFNTRLEKGAVLAHGAVTLYDTVIPAGALAEGNPAKITKSAATDADRQRIFGLIPSRWIHYEHDNIAKAIGANPPKVQKSYPGIDGKQYWGANVKVDPTAQIHPTVIFGGNVTVGAHTRIGPNVIIARAIIGHHCDIRASTNIRADTVLGNYVYLGERTHVGRQALLFNGSATYADQQLPARSISYGDPAKVRVLDATMREQMVFFYGRDWPTYERQATPAELKNYKLPE